MQFTKVEVGAIEQVAVQAEKTEFRPLSDLQLALIGGGIGDVVWG